MAVIDHLDIKDELKATRTRGVVAELQLVCNITNKRMGEYTASNGMSQSTTIFSNRNTKYIVY